MFKMDTSLCTFHHIGNVFVDCVSPATIVIYILKCKETLLQNTYILPRHKVLRMCYDFKIHLDKWNRRCVQKYRFYILIINVNVGLIEAHKSL